MLEPHLAEMMARAEAAKVTAMRFLRLDGAQLRLGVMQTIGPMQFVNFLAGFRTAHPGIDITLIEAGPEQLSDMLEKGELNVTLMARPDGCGASLQAHPLYRERFVIGCATGHPLARHNVIRVA